MRGVGVVGSVLLAVMLASCGTPGAHAGASGPGPITTISATTPPVATPSESATPTTSPKPTVPDAGEAIDVSDFDSAHFASPTGRIWCAMSADWTLCHFPAGMNMKRVPKPAKVCPGAGLDVTGVSIAAKAEYFCSGGAEALPQTSGLYVDWWRSTGFPSVKYQANKLAVLPYGRKLSYHSFVCVSEQAGISCGDSDTGIGFRVAKAGITFIG